jgi:membrane-anchored protein YejM (alkaline phosphatase superfamily)
MYALRHLGIYRSISPESHMFIKQAFNNISLERKGANNRSYHRFRYLWQWFRRIYIVYLSSNSYFSYVQYVAKAAKQEARKTRT